MSARQQLQTFFNRCGRSEFINALASAWLNEVLPGIRALIGCDQGMEYHSEGDVGIHTAMVFEELERVFRADVGRGPDFIEQLSALMHDWKKPVTRAANPDGTVSFPGHEALAAAEIGAVATRLNLDQREQEKLAYLVAYHGDAHKFPDLPPEKQEELRQSPHLESLCALQKADALSCHCGKGGHLPVHWERMKPPRV